MDYSKQHGAITHRSKARRTYDIMLLNIASCNFVSKPYLLAVSDKLTSYRALNKALGCGHLKELTLVQKLGGKKRTIKYYCITRDGLAYLAENHQAFPSQFAWTEYLIPPAERMKTKLQPLSANRMARFLAVSGTSFLMSVSGVQTEHIFTSAVISEEVFNVAAPLPLENRHRNIEQIIAEAKRRARAECDSAEITGSDIIYYNSFEIKQELAQCSGRYSDFHGGRYTGILESATRTVLVYTGNKGGMAWSTVATKPEFSALHTYSAKYSRYQNLPAGENHGIMFVDNARLFAALYLDEKSKRRTEAFAERVNSLTIFPINQGGLCSLLDYMDTDDAQFETSFVSEAVASGIYELNHEGYTSLFPLRTKQGIPMAIGVFLDAVKLNRMRKIYAKTNVPYGIICCGWQIDYYNRVAPEALYMTIDREEG